jgi:hypothetical protein
MCDKPEMSDNYRIVHCFECAHAEMTYGWECKYCDFWQPDGGDAMYLSGNFFCAAGELSADAIVDREAVRTEWLETWRREQAGNVGKKDWEKDFD